MEANDEQAAPAAAGAPEPEPPSGGPEPEPDAISDALLRASKALRRLSKMRTEGETSGEDYEKVVRRATRLTKQSTAILDSMNNPPQG